MIRGLPSSHLAQIKTLNRKKHVLQVQTSQTHRVTIDRFLLLSGNLFCPGKYRSIYDDIARSPCSKLALLQFMAPHFRNGKCRPHKFHRRRTVLRRETGERQMGLKRSIMSRIGLEHPENFIPCVWSRLD